MTTVLQHPISLVLAIAAGWLVYRLARSRGVR